MAVAKKWVTTENKNHRKKINSNAPQRSKKTHALWTTLNESSTTKGG